MSFETGGFAQVAMAGSIFVCGTGTRLPIRKLYMKTVSGKSKYNAGADSVTGSKTCGLRLLCPLPGIIPKRRSTCVLETRTRSTCVLTIRVLEYLKVFTKHARRPDQDQTSAANVGRHGAQTTSCRRRHRRRSSANRPDAHYGKANSPMSRSSL